MSGRTTTDLSIGWIGHPVPVGMHKSHLRRRQTTGKFLLKILDDILFRPPITSRTEGKGLGDRCHGRFGRRAVVLVLILIRIILILVVVGVAVRRSHHNNDNVGKYNLPFSSALLNYLAQYVPP